MADALSAPASSTTKYWLVVAAWAAVLILSDLPDILTDALGGQVLEWLPWAKAGFMALLLILCLAWKPLRLLWKFALVMLVFAVFFPLTQLIYWSEWWQSRFSNLQVSFFQYYLGIFLLDLVLAAAVIVALWIVKRRRQAFYLCRGQLDAPIEPVPWLGIKKGESWRAFGWIFAFCATLAVFFPTVFAIRPDGELLLKALPLLPAAALFAAINAFTEESYYRLSLLSTLPDAVGRTQAMLLNITLFGLAHYLYGSPPGILGFAMTGFLAFLMGKAILETKGLFWAWLIHFLPDVIVFFSYALIWMQ